jgi:hypothetical protein
MFRRFLTAGPLLTLVACAPTSTTTPARDPFFAPGQTWLLSFASPTPSDARKTTEWTMPVGPRISAEAGVPSYAYTYQIKELNTSNQNVFSYYAAGVAPAYIEVANTISFPGHVLTQFCIVRSPKLSSDDSLEGILLFINFKSRVATHDDLPQDLVYNYLRTGWNTEFQSCSLKKINRHEVVEA